MCLLNKNLVQLFCRENQEKMENLGLKGHLVLGEIPEKMGHQDLKGLLDLQDRLVNAELQDLQVQQAFK